MTWFCGLFSLMLLGSDPWVGGSQLPLTLARRFAGRYTCCLYLALLISPAHWRNARCSASARFGGQAPTVSATKALRTRACCCTHVSAPRACRVAAGKSRGGLRSVLSQHCAPKGADVNVASAVLGLPFCRLFAFQAKTPSATGWRCTAQSKRGRLCEATITLLAK